MIILILLESGIEGIENRKIKAVNASIASI
jgi:hypothetical protein